VARSTNVACHRAFGIFAKEVKLWYWQNSLRGIKYTGARQTPERDL
jgi:hypothetical protein